ncbi:MAG: hypothetical protein AAGG56_06415 [Pseudomonadota bacterium]
MNIGRLALVPIAAAAVLLPGSPTEANPQVRACADRGKVIERLEERYGETLKSVGLHKNRGVIEVYASSSTGTWTILLTRPDGLACLVASGEAWESLDLPDVPAGDDV